MALDGAYGASARGACLGLAFLTFTTVLGLDLHTHAQAGNRSETGRKSLGFGGGGGGGGWEVKKR